MQETVQTAQPDGVPPLGLTGERTLPDVPAENYWFRRHLAVYEWVAERGPGAPGDRRGRQPRRPRACAPQVHASGGPLRARSRREPLRAVRRGRVPPDDRAHGELRGRTAALPRHVAAGRGRVRLDTEPAHAGTARGPEVG